MITLDPDHLLHLRGLARRTSSESPVTLLPGGFVTRAKGQGLEAADIRLFNYGDDPRHIDRNATARSGQMQVRTFQAERDRTLLLLADFRPSMLWGTRRTFRSIAAAEALAIVGWRAIAEGGRVGMLAVSAGEPVFSKPRARERSMVSLIGAMVRAHAAALDKANDIDPPLADALELADRLIPRGTEIVLATAFDTPGSTFDDTVKALGRRAKLSAIRIVDAFETKAPPLSYRFCTASGYSGVASRPEINHTDANDLISSTFQVALPPEEQVAFA